MEYSLQYMHEQISKLSDKVEQITNLLGNMQSTCALRHSIDLKEQISLIKKDVQYIQKEITNHLESAKQSNDTLLVVQKKIQEIKVDIDLIRIRISTIQMQNKSQKQKKYNFHSSVSIGILIAVLSAILIALGGIIWEHITSSSNRYYEQIQYNHEKIPKMRHYNMKNK